MSQNLTFRQIFDRLIGHEGGYVNHPQDPGGETHWELPNVPRLLMVICMQ